MKTAKNWYSRLLLLGAFGFMTVNTQAQAVLNTDVEEFADGIVLVKDKVVPIGLVILALLWGLKYGKKILARVSG